jgi:hypothetical protein
MTKKSGSAAPKVESGADVTQEKLNELYTAHQVHTLAQMIYQQIAARRSGGPAWGPNPGAGIPSPMNGRPFAGGSPGNAQGLPHPLMYWYP